MVRAGSYKVCRVSTESAVPYPALVARKSGLQGVGLGLLVWSWFNVLNFPNLGCMVCATRCKLLDVWRQKNTGDVFLMSIEVGDWHQLCAVETLNEVPHEYIALLND